MDLSFPAYKLSTPPSEEEGVIFYETLRKGAEKTSIRIVDDLKVPKPTLGLRRLALIKQGHKLYKFHTAVYTLGDLVRLNQAGCLWIDSKGKQFKLPKLNLFRLEYHKITATFQKTGYVILALENETQRFRSLYGPPSAAYGAILMVSGKIKLFYGYGLPEHTKKHVKV